MIRIRLDERTLGRTRLAISPLHEVVRGIELVHRTRDRPAAPWPYTAWVTRAREVLRTVPRTRPLLLFAELYGEDHGRPTPDAFQPAPRSTRPTLTEELRTVRDTPAALIAAQCAKHYPEGPPAFLRPYLDDTSRAFGRLADAVEEFWERALAPHWPAMRAVLEEELLARARALAERGPEIVMGALGDTTCWEAPTLSLPKRKESAVDATDRRLLLVPLVMACGRPSCSTDDPHRLMVTYQARGAAVLAERPGSAKPDRLARLIGSGRAALVRALREPATTSGLAAVLGRAASTVSEQLTALQAAGIVSRTRLDRQVIYALEPDGVALLRLFGEDSVPAETLGENPGAA